MCVFMRFFFETAQYDTTYLEKADFHFEICAAYD